MLDYHLVRAIRDMGNSCNLVRVLNGLNCGQLEICLEKGVLFNITASRGNHLFSPSGEGAESEKKRFWLGKREAE